MHQNGGTQQQECGTAIQTLSDLAWLQKGAERSITEGQAAAEQEDSPGQDCSAQVGIGQVGVVEHSTVHENI